MKFRVLPAMLLLLASAAQCDDASSFTTEHNAAVKGTLPFEDKRDFEQARRGFIGTLADPILRAADGRAVFSLGLYDFVDGEPPATVNPSLWRQSQLNRIHGLFEVVEGIYQIRGFDLSQMTVIRGESGWIVVDPLLTAAPAAAAMALVEEHLGTRPVKAVIYTHSHADHFGGIRGVVDVADVKAGKVRVVAPAGLFEAAVSENVAAGNAMSRRATYMYGNLLPKSPTGDIGAGLGQTLSLDQIGLIEPTHYVEKTGERMTLDGIEFEFQVTPDAEAPAEFMFYLPQFRAFCQAEEMSHTLHNLYTLRGAKVRNGLVWSRHIDDAIRLFGERTDVSFGSHHWPTWGTADVVRFWEGQRDVYRYIHDQTLRLANHGMTMDEIAETLSLPDSIGKDFSNRGYYGTVSHNAKAQYQLYFGWFDGNPAHLNPLPATESGKRYVDWMGGSAAMLERARKSLDTGDYRWVAEVMNHLVFAEPDNEDARAVLAEAYRQLAFQAESGPWRNFYLTGAQELVRGVAKLPALSALSPDMFAAVTPTLYLDYLGVRLNGPKAGGHALKFNLAFPDRNEKAMVWLNNGVLNHRMNAAHDEPDVSVTLPLGLLHRASMQGAVSPRMLASGLIKIDGSEAAFDTLLGLLDRFDSWFPIVTP